MNHGNYISRSVCRRIWKNYSWKRLKKGMSGILYVYKHSGFTVGTLRLL